MELWRNVTLGDPLLEVGSGRLPSRNGTFTGDLQSEILLRRLSQAASVLVAILRLHSLRPLRSALICTLPMVLNCGRGAKEVWMRTLRWLSLFAIEE
jgi:hypothetical protein